MRNLKQEQRDARRDLRRGEAPEAPSQEAETPVPAPAPAPTPVPAPAPAPEEGTGGSSGKMPAVGTDARKAEYDRLGWAYDDTIPGYGKKTNPTQEELDRADSAGGKTGAVYDYIKNMGSNYGLFN